MFSYILEFFDGTYRPARAWFPAGARECVDNPEAIRYIHGPILSMGSASRLARMLNQKAPPCGELLAFIKINALRGTFAKASADDIIEMASNIYARSQVRRFSSVEEMREMTQGREHPDGKKCPRCKADLLMNLLAEEWCSAIGCEYGLDSPRKYEHGH